MISVLKRTIGDLVVERPARAKIFESLGIDFCCGGRKLLEQACRELSMDPRMIEKVLATFDEQAVAGRADTDWSVATLTELVAHIEGTHHAYLKRDLPQLTAWVNKVADRHGGHDPRLVKLAQVFAEFTADMTLHMQKEETVLFPLCRDLELGNAKSAADHCGSVQNPVRVMMAEHDDAGDALEQMAQLTDDFTPPADACNTFRALFDGLAQLRRDTHQHVHKENNILFPRAVALEAELTGRPVETAGVN